MSLPHVQISDFIDISRNQNARNKISEQINKPRTSHLWVSNGGKFEIHSGLALKHGSPVYPATQSSEKARCDIIFFSVIAAFKGNEWKYISLGEVNIIGFRAETNCVLVSQR
ncbi:hypothetical protein CDAR_200761 [Caerostris darwini]|uniref:Uncharacterized protein n=1 Tax=Caerostris darwini TaxID=1538125 RepID=A0AAV4PZ00_9ARAC|nr:hypothetical protein CDAR_200761 [Caerostris darwini]